MKAKERNRWAAIREKGSYRFCMKNGAFLIGLFAFFPGNLRAVSGSYDVSIYWLIGGSLFVSLTVGYLVAGVIWTVQESLFVE